jgi:lipopolysaccharide export system permease protein
LPFSILSQRSGRSGGFIAGLLIYLVYYFLTSLAETLTTDAALSPLLTFWTLHLLLLAAGLHLLHRNAQERPSRLLENLDGMIVRLRSLRSRDAHP